MADSVNSTLIPNELMVGAAIKGKLIHVFEHSGSSSRTNGYDSEHAELIRANGLPLGCGTPLASRISLSIIYFRVRH